MNMVRRLLLVCSLLVVAVVTVGEAFCNLHPPPPPSLQWSQVNDKSLGLTSPASASASGSASGSGASLSSSSWGRRAQLHRSTTRLTVKKKPQDATKRENDTSKANNNLLETIKGYNPATLIALPFVAIVGLDLVLNIVFLTKRTVEMVLFGQAPNSDPWW
jgi:hypothetical protein